MGNTQLGNLGYSGVCPVPMRRNADWRVTAKTGSFAATGMPASVSGNSFDADNAMTAFNGTSLAAADLCALPRQLASAPAV